MEYCQLSENLSICRILNGMWQVAGLHGKIDPKRAIEAMFAYHDAGFTTWDLADHYGPAETFIGTFRDRLRQRDGLAGLDNIIALTKWAPSPTKIYRQSVEANINIALKKMNVKALDMLQFHWWNYEDDSYLMALDYLTDLHYKGIIKNIGLTNFDTERLQIILDRGIPVISNQVQFSLVDSRPSVAMSDLCRDRGVKLLAYGTLAGGFLTSTYLNKPEPNLWTMETASQKKYLNTIKAFGGWRLFQELLKVLNNIAIERRVSIANIASRYILDMPSVAGIIIGTRLGIKEHIDDNQRTFDLKLNKDDLKKIQAVLSQSRDVFKIIGDCGSEYRR
jgi:aryl-alcohol dehydrogenase-like predicted oxidoreductase